MKKKALAIVLVICMVLSMLPMTAFAAPVKRSLTPMVSDNTPELQAMPEAPAETNGDYTITKHSTGPGVTASNPSDSADAGDEVLLLVNPDPGYMAYVDDHGLNLEFTYIGFDMYVFTMPAKNVTLDFYFEPIDGPSYSISVNAPEGCNWSLMNGITSAHAGESVYLFLQEEETYTFDPETAVTANCEDLYYLGTLDEEGEQHVYELWMPAQDVTISIDTTPVVRERSISVYINEPTFGTVQLAMGNTALPGHAVYFTAAPHPGYRVSSIRTFSGAAVTHQDGNLYSFVMPDADETLYVYFTENINPLSVTVETGLGGTASLSHTEAQEGDTVTLTCTPEEGYRVARIAGVNGLVDNGDGTYTFTMPGEAVNIQVLFLRHENPFLDVNETHFFYTPVLWAVENGITNGLNDTLFGPFAVCNRAQVVTFLWRYAGSPKPTTTENPFTDVHKDSFYYDAVLWAVENGITMGVSSTEFGPGMPCNRAQVVTFLWRLMEQPAPVQTEHPFTDVDAGSFYELPVLWALENNITTGADTTHFNPVGQCQRAQVVTFLYRVDQIPVDYAVRWAINGAVETPSTQGTVTLSHASAFPGEIITATVIPAEGYVLEAVKCVSGSEVTQISDTEFTFVMPDFAELFQVYFTEAPEESEPTDPTEPTEPVDPEPTDPTEPTEPVDPEPTDPTEPTEPVQTYSLDLRDNGNGRVAYVDGKTEAAVGESILFYAVPNEGYYLDHVGVFNPNNTIDVTTIQILEHENGLYELIMIPHDLIMTCYFYPIA